MKPLHGIRVIEVAMFGMVPIAGCVLADYGADVIKIEHPIKGDPVRNLSSWGIAPDTKGITFLWEVFNRGKRSVGIDLGTERGRALLDRLLAESDVFLTSLLPETRRRLRIEPSDIHAGFPRIIYARGSAHGPVGPEAERGGFDGVTYWQRTGIGTASVDSDADYPASQPTPGFGDVQTGMHLAGGIGTALFHRERTGLGSTVDTSLLASGLWAAQASILGAALTEQDRLPKTPRALVANALTNTYRTSDGRFISLAMLTSDRYWSGFCSVIGREDLATDPRFDSSATRAKNRVECIHELDEVFAQHTLSEWADLLSRQSGQWSVVRTAGETVEDGQAIANGYLHWLTYESGVRLPMTPAPVQFNQSHVETTRAPEHGEHTESVLLDLGFDWEELGTLKADSVIS